MAHRFLHTLLLPLFSAAAIFFLFPRQSFAGKRPHAFIENKGQVTDQQGNARSDIDYKLQAAGGLSLFIGKGQLHYQWVKAGPQSGRPTAVGHRSAEPVPLDFYRMDVTLVGANYEAVVTTDKPSDYRERYILPSVRISGVVAHSFQKITYHNIYPNIDWIFYFNADGKLEHDFIVHPGGNPSDIRLQYGGASKLSVDGGGRLTATTPLGSVMESAPYAYVEGTQRKVKASFKLNGNFLSFSTAAYSGTLVIDPIVDWGTYFGGTDADMAYDNVIGKDGNVYVAGATSSAANIATTGAYQFTYAAGSAYLNDAFVSKFSPDGNCLWSTYYGTSAEDAAKSISADTNGNIYIAGYTASTAGLSSMGAQQPLGGGGYDGFVARFDTAGQRVWGTYFGGEGDDGGYGPIALHCDRFNNIYLTGQTNSATGIATTGANQPALYGGAGDQDAFLAKYSNSGVLQWATYVGGNFGDAAYAVTNDTVGNIYITGNTNSTAGIATVGQTVNGGSYDAFVAKFSNTGSRLWGTYIGGNFDEYALSIACDNAANLYITGLTTSTSGLASTGAHQTAYGGGYQDVMLARLNSGGTVQWATYFGGNSEDQGDKVIAASNGDLYLSGFTGSDTGIISGAAFQSALGGAYDGMVARFTNSGILVWGSYLGGVDADEAFSIASDNTFNLYTTGNTTSATGIATNGSWQTSYGGGDYDAFLMRIKDCSAPAMPDTIFGPIAICSGTTNIYTALSAYANSYNWILPSGWTGNSTTGTIMVINNGSSGTIKVAALNDCSLSDTASLAVTVNALPVMPQINQSGNTLSVSGTYSSYQWNKDGQAITGANAATYTLTSDGTYSVTVTNAAGCGITCDPVNLNVTGINDPLSQNGISVYPNPAATAVFISTPVNISAELSNLVGQVLQRVELKNGVNKLSLDNLAVGVYLLRMEKNGNCLGAQKIIKN